MRRLLLAVFILTISTQCFAQTQTQTLPMQQEIAYGTSGYANGLVEYMGSALPGVITSTANWQILKLYYDSNSNVVAIVPATRTGAYNKNGGTETRNQPTTQTTHTLDKGGTP